MRTAASRRAAQGGAPVTEYNRAHNDRRYWPKYLLATDGGDAPTAVIVRTLPRDGTRTVHVPDCYRARDTFTEEVPADDIGLLRAVDGTRQMVCRHCLHWGLWEWTDTEDDE